MTITPERGQKRARSRSLQPDAAAGPQAKRSSGAGGGPGGANGPGKRARLSRGALSGATAAAQRNREKAEEAQLPPGLRAEEEAAARQREESRLRSQLLAATQERRLERARREQAERERLLWAAEAEAAEEEEEAGRLRAAQRQRLTDECMRLLTRTATLADHALLARYVVELYVQGGAGGAALREGGLAADLEAMLGGEAAGFARAFLQAARARHA